MEFIKKLNEIERSIEQKLNRLTIALNNEVKIVNKELAYKTGDMTSAVTPKLARHEAGQLVSEVYYDPGKLFNKRKPYQYKRGQRKGSYAKPDRNYPSYVIKGTPNMKARPILTIAWERVRQKPEFRDFAKNIVTRGINET